MKFFITTALALAAAVYAYAQFGDRLPATGGSTNILAGEVIKVVDGDSIELKIGPDVRRLELAGIDAPEIGQHFGVHAEGHLADLVANRIVRIEVHKTNRYGEILGELFLDDISINKLMLTDGFAWARRGLFEDPYWAGLESLARDRGFGLWRDEDPMPPWDFRNLAREST